MKLPVSLLRTLGASLVALSFSACSGNEAPDALLAKAQESMRASDPRAAEIHLKNLLQQDETNAQARFLLDHRCNLATWPARRSRADASACSWTAGGSP